MRSHRKRGPVPASSLWAMRAFFIRRTAPGSDYAELVAYRHVHGTVALRHSCIEIADYCLAVYDKLPNHTKDGFSYDWDIIPAIIDTIDWQIDRKNRPAPKAAAAMVTRALAKHAPEPPA